MPSKIDHIGLGAPRDKFDDVVAWYTKVLAPLKYDEVKRFPGVVGLGADGIPDFWIAARDGPSQLGIHLAFRAPGGLCFEYEYYALLFSPFFFFSSSVSAIILSCSILDMFPLS
jgi:hypothetical protein